nr:unnamed protein product [Callosobruchus analis]
MKMQETEVCDICNKIVSDDDEGLLCEECLIWKHRVCLSIGLKLYQRLTKSEDPWVCDSCKERHANTGTRKQKVKQDGTYTLADVMAKLEDMDRKYNQLFVKYNEQVAQNNLLKQEILQIKKQLNTNEQRELNKNMTIHGVPYQNQEKVLDIVKKIGEQLQVPIADGTITAFRVGKTNNDNRPIKVIFQDEETKTNMLRSKLKVTLNTQKLGFSTNRKIFLNHDLTKRNLELFKETQKFRKDNDYKFLWISSGKILLRKNENTKIILVEDEDDLKN